MYVYLVCGCARVCGSHKYSIYPLQSLMNVEFFSFVFPEFQVVDVGKYFSSLVEPDIVRVDWMLRTSQMTGPTPRFRGSIDVGYVTDVTSDDDKLVFRDTPKKTTLRVVSNFVCLFVRLFLFLFVVVVFFFYVYLSYVVAPLTSIILRHFQ